MPTITDRKTALLTKFLLSIILFTCLIYNGHASPTILKEASIIKNFYTVNHQSIYWFDTARNSRRATEWLDEMNDSEQYGIRPDKSLIAQMKSVLSDRKKLDPVAKEEKDKQITGMVLGFIKDLKEGNIHFDYDEVKTSKDSSYIFQLMDSRYEGKVSKIVASMDCKDPEYLVLKKYLNDSIKETVSFKYKTVVLAMNYRRYLTAYHQPEYILVNIPTAEATYFKNDVPTIQMRTVPGKKSKPTPTISSYVTSIVTFPYWNVPFDVAVKEIIPKIRKNENYLEQNNFDVVDAKGNVIDDSDINWKDYNGRNFPYFFRQSTGSENSLGVLKFNLQNPFSIFLHATSNPGAFLRDNRFLSHGCIRLEKPLDLADALLRGKLDIEALKSGKKDNEPNTIMLPEKVPTFIIYVPLMVADNKVTFLKDVYGLIK